MFHLLQATDTTKILDGTNNFLIEIAKDEPLLAVGLAVYIISQISLHFSRKAERASAKERKEREEKRDGRIEEHNKEVREKLGGITNGVITNSSAIGTHEKTLSRIEITHEKTQEEVRGLDKSVDKLANNVSRFVAAMNELPEIKTTVQLNSREIQTLKDKTNQIEGRL